MSYLVQIILFNIATTISQVATDVMSSRYELSENWKKHGIYTDTEDVHLRLAVETAVYSLKVKR